MNQLILRTQCDVFLWDILDVNIIKAHPRPRQHHPCSHRLRGHCQVGRRMRSTGSTQASTLKFRFRPDNVVVQIIDPLVGAASCQGLRGEGSASSQGDRRCGRSCGRRYSRRPPRPLWPSLRPPAAPAAAAAKNGRGAKPKG